MVDVALIELEGVVFETRELRQGALRDAFAAHGVDGSVCLDVVMRDLVMLTAERAFSQRLATGGLSLAPGARRFVEDAGAAARLGAVTRAKRADADVMLRLAGLEGAFAVVVCSDDVLEPKPAPDGYHLALDRLTRSRPFGREAAIAFEDSVEGIRAARAAQLRCVVIGSLPAHAAIEANAFVPTLDGLSLTQADQLSLPGRERVV